MKVISEAVKGRSISSVSHSFLNRFTRYIILFIHPSTVSFHSRAKRVDYE